MGLRNLKRHNKLVKKKVEERNISKKTFPFDLDAEMHRALDLQKNGELRAAEEIYKKVLRVDPNHSHSLHMVGMLAYQVGKYDFAVEMIKKSIKRNPLQPGFYNNLGMVYLKKNEIESAIECLQKAIKLKPDYVDALTNLGNTLKQAKNWTEAEAWYKKALAIDPKDYETCNNLANMYQEMGEDELAQEYFDLVFSIKPDFSEVYLVTAEKCEKEGKYSQAIYYYERFLQYFPDDLSALFSLARIYSNLASYEKAEKYYLHLASLAPENPEVYFHWGELYKQQGDFDKAKDLYNKALQFKPDHGLALLGKTVTKKFVSNDDEDLLTLKTIFEKKDQPLEERRHFAFALGKIYDDLGLYKEAFSHYRAANDMVKEGTKFDPAELKRLNQRIIEGFTPKIFEKMSLPHPKSSPHIFIVGMPRSGTTLTEQILASHPAVLGGGELTLISEIKERLSLKTKANWPFPECMQHVTPSLLEEMAIAYDSAVQKNAVCVGPIRRMTDKMPYNFRYLGLIAMLFPKAYIIHCRRNPMDTCLSNYFQNFSDAHTHAFDLQQLGFFYREYLRLMEHWRQVLPGRIFEVDYEALISDPEVTVRQLINFVGLEWHEDCLAFHKTKRQVKTASLWQVRQPIYTKSVERWQNYEEFLGPLIEALEGRNFA